jgi:hypothetical protein
MCICDAFEAESPVQSGEGAMVRLGCHQESRVGASLLRDLNSPSSKQKVSFAESLPVPVHVEESDSARAVRLLHLLNIFVQLKESTGVRARPFLAYWRTTWIPDFS